MRKRKRMKGRKYKKMLRTFNTPAWKTLIDILCYYEIVGQLQYLGEGYAENILP